jgi:hypothetical protein
MASEGFAYDHPEYNVTHTAPLFFSNVTSSASVIKIPVFAASRLKAIRGAVGTATGTNDVAGFDIFRGTTSIAAITFGTNTVGSIITAVEVAAATAGTCTDFFDIKAKATTSTMAGYLILEYEILAGATIVK